MRRVLPILVSAGFVMVIPRRKKYRPWNPEAYAQQAFSPADRLPEDDLVFFLLDIVAQLDLDAFYASYEVETRGQPPFKPSMLVCLLLYSYCVGVYSSRKIAKACERNLAFLAIVGDDRPDFRTISDFRKGHLQLLAELFVQVLQLAAEAGMVRLGNVAFDGSKFTGQASRHKAMSYGYMIKEEARLKDEIKALLEQADKTDAEEDAVHGSRRGDGDVFAEGSFDGGVAAFRGPGQEAPRAAEFAHPDSPALHGRPFRPGDRH